MPRVFNIHDFFEKAIKVHNNFYDYSLVKYEGCKKNIKIICPIHGVFEQRPGHHSNGSGCGKCRTEKMRGLLSLNTGVFINNAEKIHGGRYDYSRVDYKGVHDNVKIVCSIHGVFEQRPNHHLNGSGCRKCATIVNSDKRRLTIKEFIQKARDVHGARYEYTLSEYFGSHILLKIQCRVHGAFSSTPANHLSGKGCPNCAEYGFNSKKVSYFYTLLSKDRKFIKVGITNNPGQRHKQLKKATPFGVIILECLEMPGAEALNLEAELKRSLKSACFTDFDGATEWFYNEKDTLKRVNTRAKNFTLPNN